MITGINREAAKQQRIDGISLRNAGQFLNARNGVGHQVNLVDWGLAIFSAKGAGHQVNLVEDIIPDVLLSAIFFENCYIPLQ